MIANLRNIPIGNVKKLVSRFFEKEKYVLHYEILQLYLRLWLKLKKIHDVLKFNQLQWLKPYTEFNTLNKINAENNKDRDRKAMYKLMNKTIYRKAMENLRKSVSTQWKRRFEMCIKTKLYVAQNIWQ